MRLAKFVAFSFVALGALLSTARQSNANLVFDNSSAFEKGYSGAGATSTGSTPNTFMGDGYILDPTTTAITGFDVYPVNLSGTNFTGLKINIFVWGTVNTGTVNATTPAFSNLLASYSLTSAGTYTSGFFFPFESAAAPGVLPGITLASPLAIPSNTIGITMAYQGTTDGTTYNSVNSLTSLITYGPPPTGGAEVFNGYYRNANSETNGNFTSTLRSLGLTNQSLALRVYGVPEPTTLMLVGIGCTALLGRRRRIA